MSNPQTTIIGQGFAGTAVAWQLWQRDQPFTIYDQSLEHSSSIVSAGIINPITGLRLTHADNYVQYKKYCDEFYHSIEQILETKFYHPLRILKLLTRPEEIKAWDSKGNQYQAIARSIIPPDTLIKILKNPDVMCLEITGAVIDAKTYLEKSRNFFKTQKLINETSLICREDDLSKMQSPHIFCEGIHVINNPFSPNLPFINAKGEILTIRANLEDLESSMINTDIFILGLGNNTFRVGATYEWNDLTTEPTPNGKTMLENKLAKHFDFPYEIIDHRAGIRPILKDQTPLLDQHPHNPNAYLLNGLASKGALYSPYLALKLCENLCDGKKLPEEYQWNRFEI